MANALIYARVSNDRQHGRSVKEQEAECRSVCSHEGWHIVAVETDNDRSASRYAKQPRKAWDAVKHRIAAGGIDVLVTWEASRSGRDLAGFVELRTLCRDHGVLVNYSGRTLDLDDDRDAFQAGLDALLAENESDRTRSRILRAMRAQAEDGMPHGRRLYGYRRTYNDSTPPQLSGQEEHPDEAPIVREVARRYASGESAYAIAEDLNRRGVARPTGAAWSDSAIGRIVKNPAYLGKRVHQGKVIGDATWKPIIDQATFDACEARYADPGRSKYRVSGDLKHLLSGIARCGKCGAPLYVGGDRGRRVYVCRDGKGHLTRSLEYLDAYVIALVLRRLATLDLDDLTVESPETIAARAEAVELRDRLDAAVAQFTAGRLSAATLAKVESDLQPRIDAAVRAGRPTTVSPLLADLAGAGVEARWDALRIEERREVVRVLFDVTVLPSSTRGRGARGFDSDAVRVEPRV